MLKKVLVLFLIAVSFNFAQLDRSKIPAAAPAPEIKIGDIESFQLDNGLKVFVVENDKLPRITFSIQFDRDPVFEGEKTGYVSLAGSLIGTETTNRSKDELNEAIDFIGAYINTSANGISGGCLSKHKEELFELASDVAKNSVFTQEELDKLVKRSLSGLQAAKDNPSAIASSVRRALIYGKDHPYGEIETEESIKNVTLDDCKSYYNTYFKPNIAYMAIVGDISVGDAEDLVEEYFADWKQAEVKPMSYSSPKAPLIRKVALVDRSTSVQSVINVTYPINLPKGHKDLSAITVMNELLGGNFSSRFMQNLREDKAYTYGARSTISSDEIVGHFTANCEARTEVTDSAITEFLYEMNRMIKEPISEKELVATKNYLSGSFARSLENPGTVASFAISTVRYNLPEDYYTNYLKRLSAVTIEDVQAVAKKYLKPDNCYVFVVGNGDEIADRLKNFSPAYKIKYYDYKGDEVDPSAKLVPEGMTGMDVISKYIEVTGGKEAYSSLKDLSMELSSEMAGMKISVKIDRKAPNKFFTEIAFPMGKQVIVFDGEKGKMSAMGNEMPLPEEQAEGIKLLGFPSSIMHLEENGIKAELTGAENIDGNNAYKVVLTLPSGKTKTQFYDVETGLRVREVETQDTPQGQMTQTSNLGDYKEVAGIKFAHTQTIQMGPQQLVMKVNSIKVNEGVDDKIFEVK